MRKEVNIMYVEDGSINIDEVKADFWERGIDLIVVVYRQGANHPTLITHKAKISKEQRQ